MDKQSTSSTRRKIFTTHEVLDMLEDEDFLDANIYLTPPGNGQLSDEDSGDEDTGGNADNLSGLQLQASASYKLRKSRAGVCQTNEYIESSSDEESSPDEDMNTVEVGNLANSNQQRRKKAIPVKRIWRHEDLDADIEQQDWPQKQPPSFLTEDLSPTQLFELFYDNEVIDDIVDLTNLYACREKGDHVFKTNREEIKAFLTILIISGYSVLPRRTMYWESSKDCRIDGIAQLMRRNRFDLIMRYLHVCDNNNLPQNDKMGKLRRYYCLLNERCLRFFPLSQNICVDESMVPYFGRHSSKQYIRGKPVRFGFKQWVLAAETGYVIQFEPYCGAEVRDKAEFGLGGAVVLDLLAELPDNMPFKLFIDNYFTGLPLLKALLDRGIHATGTLRTNRMEKCPLDSKKMKKSERGTTDYHVDKNHNLLVLQWNDNNLVTMASNCEKVYPTGTVRRWSKKEKAFVNIEQPNIVKAYNKCMGGVDRADQNIAYYRINMRTKKWWWPLFVWPIDMVIQNAWILYKASSLAQSSPLDLLAFRRSITATYMGKYCSSQRSFGRPKPLSCRVPNDVRFDNIGHFSVDVPTQRRCAYCHKNTRKGCSKCSVGLHQSCFNVFHGHQENGL